MILLVAMTQISIKALKSFIFAVTALMFAASAVAAEISAITVTGDGEHTRITLLADAEIEHASFLSVDEGGAQVQLVVPGSVVLPNAQTPPPGGAVASYEILDGQVSFNLLAPMMVSRALDLAPTSSERRYRLVVDLVRVAPVRFDRAARNDVAKRESYILANQVRSVREENVPALSATRPDHYVIVIDAGHGGKDPGALSSSGKREKDLVLQTALTLRDKLNANGRYKVYLTRDTDVYIEHEDRVSMARNWGADLFISLHADAAGNSEVSGATVYTLSARGERRVDGEAKTNGWDLPIEDGTPVAVSGILTDLIKRETKSNSSIFAEMLTPELAKAGPVVRNSHRRENFYVLLAPDVPAVLVEIGFLTNRADVTRLGSVNGRAATASAISRAIDKYFAQRDLLYAAN